MSQYKIVSIRIQNEQDIVLVRQRARQIALLLGFVLREQTAIATSVSEITRNAYNYAKGGTAEFLVDFIDATQYLLINIKDTGPGIKNLEEIMNGSYKSQTGLGMGIIGSRRLMDLFRIQSDDQGTIVQLGKEIHRLKKLITASDIASISDALVKESTFSVYEELKKQNQELLSALDDVRKRQEDLISVNEELQETNRGVVALYAELDEKAEHLKELNEIRSRFFSNMSHEFKTPLNSIVALTRLLSADGAFSEEKNKQIQYIKKSAENLLDLVSDLLDIAKIEAGKYKIKPDFFSIDTMFGALRGMLRPLLVNPNVSLEFENNCPVKELYSDEGKVSQILRNFISNALKFTSSGVIRIKAELDAERNNIVFSVCDTGIGIAEKDQAYIFEEFTQVEHPTEKSVKGTGLGLPLSKKLASLLLGKIWLTSKPGEGSTFYFSIPYSYPKAEETEQPIITLNPVTTKSKFQLLHLQESPGTTQKLNELFNNSEYNLLIAKNVEEANDILQVLHPLAIVFAAPFPDYRIKKSLEFLKSKIRYSGHVLIITDEVKNSGDFWIRPPGPKEIMNILKSVSDSQRTNKILCIDDQEISRYLIKELIYDLNFEILEADDGERGILLAELEKPELIFLDLNMPGTDGYEVLTILKNSEATKDVPVVINSSKDLTDEEDIKFKESCSAIVSKHVLSDNDAENILQDIILRTLSVFRFDGIEE